MKERSLKIREVFHLTPLLHFPAPRWPLGVFFVTLPFPQKDYFHQYIQETKLHICTPLGCFAMPSTIINSTQGKERSSFEQEAKISPRKRLSLLCGGLVFLCESKEEHHFIISSQPQCVVSALGRGRPGCLMDSQVIFVQVHLTPRLMETKEEPCPGPITYPLP